ncbi:MAG: hypothetical protein R3C49_07440 [Planctomycetaceae bacterium]
MSQAIRVFRVVAAVAALWLLTAQSSRAPGQEADTVVVAGDVSETVEAVAAFQERWINGATTVISLKGGADAGGLAGIRQGDLQLLAESLVIADTLTTHGHELRVYAEGRVRFRQGIEQQSLESLTIGLVSLNELDLRTSSSAPQPLTRPSRLMQSALAQLKLSDSARIATVGMQTDVDPFLPPQFEPVPAEGPSRRIQVRPRSSDPLRFESFQSRDTVPEEKVYIITGGVNVLVDGMPLPIGGGVVQTGVLDLSADRVVVWTQPNGAESLELNQTLEQSFSTRFQLYLEGNILIRQGQNTVTASHAFVDVNNDRALLLNAELRALIPGSGGQVRVRAERIRQLSANRFHAQNGWTTTSPYGKPGYRLQAQNIFVNPGPISPFTVIDPNTGQPKYGQPLWITAENSQFVIGDVPVLTLPRISAPAEDPNIPIRSATVKHDRIFGLQVKTVWDLTKIMGMPKQPGMQWDLMADYLSERGAAIGVGGKYDTRNDGGRVLGNGSIIYQYDDDYDTLGLDRQRVNPGTENRGQIIWRHRQELPGDAMIFGEIGLLSDRNYRESYHEIDYDTDKDAETLLGARQDLGLWSGTLIGRTELNEFETSTDWLPKADILGFSQPLFDGLMYWSSQSSLGYADLEPGAPPTDPANDPYAFGATPYVQDASGMVAMTRHQIDAPFMIGPVNFRPYAMGEAAFWDQGRFEKDVDRLLFNGGVEAHVGASKVMPFVKNELWNLNGLAHKSDVFLNYSYTDVSRNINDILQYNEFDDNPTERFRHRYANQIFGGTIPAEFDPRNYAIRTGAGLWTSAPYHELVDDQQVLRLRWRNRLQTKSLYSDSGRIRDWMVWETGASYFPNAADDNFGENFGMIYGNYRWNISDRTSILADGIYDLFENAQNVWSVGILSQRSLRGSVYLGYRKVEANHFLDSQTLVASYSYLMSPKWISTGALAYDVAAGESRGSSLTFSRVGLDWILHLGVGIDTSKNNVGAAIALEPRFGPPSPTNLSYLLGLQ